MTMNVSPLTLGTSGLGQDTRPGSAEEAAAVEVAIDLLRSGHSFIDTSNEYSGGRSESVIGLAIAELGKDVRARVISKVDRDPRTGVFDRDRVLRSFDETTSRLGVDRLPLLHLHDPYTVTFEDAIGRGGAVEGLIELRDSGRVDGIGIAAGPVPLVARYVETGIFDALLVHNRYTLVDTSAASVFVDAKKRAMTVFNAAPFGSGLLATGAREGAIYNYRPAGSGLLEWVRQLERICQGFDVPLPAVALRFSTRSQIVDSTVVGVASPGRRAQLDELAAIPIPDDIWSEIDGLNSAPSPVNDDAYV